ncbi:MAG: hypothetical protein AVDCRST_MAG56-7423 [uncultured Cytophagales bacterium]|uniref:DUF3052 domain-containing protein n=1 Tax=uncultured Cytophagales bacterium TaxID=158755 RepID=A0A6J4L5Q2_9SPHI|nr:MAG: hypothetical protein AVDCRST_MAG56-7423 [uncultured Cytophagales bacterium]
MDAVFKKLNYKGQPVVVCLNAPASFDGRLQSIAGEAQVVTELEAAPEIEFLVAFVTRQEEIDRLVPQAAPRLKGDAVLWFCYPKGTSKRYACNFNRDTGWGVLGPHGLEGVRQVAIDEDWTALRFRKVDYIKTMTRKFGALSEGGKAKTGQTAE